MDTGLFSRIYISFDISGHWVLCNIHHISLVDMPLLWIRVSFHVFTSLLTYLVTGSYVMYIIYPYLICPCYGYGSLFSCIYISFDISGHRVLCNIHHMYLYNMRLSGMWISFHVLAYLWTYLVTESCTCMSYTKIYIYTYIHHTMLRSLIYI